MALIVPSGGLISQVNGRVDDKVYYRGRWGNVVRAWVNPTNTITPVRTAVRLLFANLVALYNSLTPDMQDDWDQFAQSLVKFNRLAQPYVPTGLQIFMERNMQLGIYGGGPLLLPPDDVNIIPVLSAAVITLTAANMTISVAFYNSPAFVPAGHTWLIYATDNQPPGRNFMSNRYRLINPPPAGSPSTFNVIVPWKTTYNPLGPTVGRKIFFKSVLVNDTTGQASQPAFCSQIVS